MPQMTDLTLAGTGSNSYTFSPVAASGGKAAWCNRANGIPRLSPRLEVTFVEPRSNTGAYRVVGSLILPKTKTVDGNQELSHQNRINFDLNYAPDSSSSERLDDVAVLKSLLSSTAFTDVVEDLTAIY